MAQAAEDAAYAKATGRPLRSFLLGLTAGGYIALGFVFFVTSQVGADELAWGFAKVLGGIVFSTGLVLVVLTGAELFTSSTL
ncbi:MAG: formate/nitrite transporter family protein, partial [Marmoricola sp.]